MDQPISAEDHQQCECCARWKICRMYVLQDGTAAWVCRSCRTGKTEDADAPTLE